MNLDPDLLRERATVELPMITWLAIHGNLCLALRHPNNAGPSRLKIIEAIQVLSGIIIAAGVMTQQEMDEANKFERQSGGYQ